MKFVIEEPSPLQSVDAVKKIIKSFRVDYETKNKKKIVNGQTPMEEYVMEAKVRPPQDND